VTAVPASETEASRRTISEAFDAWSKGTGAITDVFAAELVWRIEGHSLSSKAHETKQHDG
jgi:hypothetical protein